MGVIPPFFVAHNMQDAHGNQWHLNTLPDLDTIHGVRLGI